MKKTKVMSAKRSFFMSVLSLVLCFAMLLGTTWAWFTDEVQSGVNQIKAGNLDVELVHTDKGGSSEVKTDTKLFDDVTLWEPGAVAYETLTVKNVGTLALNYEISILTENEIKIDNHGLSEVLQVGTIDRALNANETRESIVSAVSSWTDLASFTKSGSLDAKTDGAPVTYVIYWKPTDNDNDYNMNNANQGTVLSIDLGVKLVAGQKAQETDSFDEKYDLSAFIQVNPENFETVLANLKDGDNLYLAAGTYAPSANNVLRIEKSNVTIVGAGVDATVIDAGDKTCSGQAGLLVSANNVTIANLTVKSAPTDDNTAKNTSPIKVTDLLGTDGDTMIENFKLENVALEGNKGHGLNLHGVTNAIINGVDVRTYSKCAISCAKASATFTNVKTAANGWGDIGCMYANNDQYNSPCNITIGAGNEFGKGLIYSERPSSAQGGKDTITFADSSAWVVTSTDSGITAIAAEAKIGNTGYATLQEAVNAATTENEVVMLKDVTLSESEKITIPANASVSIDGDGHTVSFAKTAAFSVDKNAAAFSLKNTEVVKTGSQAGYAVLTPHGFHGLVSVDNCTLKNLKYGVYMDPTDSTENHATLSITNCAYDNTVWGYCFDNRPVVTTNVTVTFNGNTGIADDHIQESFA